jgi:2-polyprenyl-3-methyl-5-hydroxy-6-metoxy-1,4-benzoquinol methylase
LRGIVDIYPQQQIFEVFCHLDLNDFYHKWFLFLREHQLGFEMIKSSSGQYLPISSIEEALKIVSENKKVDYSDQEIDYILRTHRFEYQKIEISSDRHTLGQDRSETLRFLDEDLTGKSVLDIGCAYGYFCFEAEKRNALRVVGTELKRYRFIGCTILKEIFGKNTEFLYQDIFDNPLKDAFDVVLLLNVIHHLKEPIKALRMASGLCNEKLIIEFPTLLDNKFKSTLPHDEPIDSSLPLIGVSLLSSQDQTYLFSKEAIKRILLDHDQLFSKIEFEQSPMSLERCIAICYK